MTANNSFDCKVATEWATSDNTPKYRRSSSSGKREGRRMNKMIVLYKTELCRSFVETATCRYGTKCQFAHGESELRPVTRHPKYKTLLCKAFWEQGSCPYGQRCCFIHISSTFSDTDPSEGNFSDADSLENFGGEYTPPLTANEMNPWWTSPSHNVDNLGTIYLPFKSDEFSSEQFHCQEDDSSIFNRACRLPIFQKLSECT